MTCVHRDLVERDLEWVEWVEWYPPPSRTGIHGHRPFAPIVSAYGPWCRLLGSRGGGPAPRVRLYRQVKGRGRRQRLAKLVPGRGKRVAEGLRSTPRPLGTEVEGPVLVGGTRVGRNTFRGI